MAKAAAKALGFISLQMINNQYKIHNQKKPPFGAVFFILKIKKEFIKNHMILLF